MRSPPSLGNYIAGGVDSRELMGIHWLDMVLIFGVAMAILAVYGYILTYFANLLEKRMANDSSSWAQSLLRWYRREIREQAMKRNGAH